MAGIIEVKDQGKLRIYDADNSHYIDIVVPSTVTANRTITIPDASFTIPQADTNTVFNPDAAVVFNESSADVDFRVESNNLDDALFVQGSDGFIGVGTQAPNTKVMVELGTNGSALTDALRLKHAGTSVNDGCRIQFTSGTSTSGAAIGALGTASNKADLTFYAGGNTERMRIDSSGRLLVGTAAPFSSGNNSSIHINVDKIATAAGAIMSECSGTGTVFHYHLRNGNGGVGGISTNGSATAFVTSSDYRLKENVSYNFDATTRLKQLKPARFNFITDADTTVDGFIAHEVSSVVPEAINGIKDAVLKWKTNDELPEGVSIGDNRLDGDGNTIIDAQGIDQSKLVPLLVKTIQELEARITTLENA